jgi:hypothetical protein
MRPDHPEERSTFERVFDVLLVCAALLAVASIAWGLDTQDGADPATKMNWLGFRCARDVTDIPQQVSQVVSGTTP